MIINKQNGTVASGNSTNSQYKPDYGDEPENTPFAQAQMPNNGIIDVYKAIKEIVRGVTWNYREPESGKIFHTVQFNGNQYERIVTGKENDLADIAFPAAFINFINMRWTSQQSAINDGSAELRIQVVMNTLNNYDDDKDTEGMYVCQRVIQEIQEHRYQYECLQKYLKLTYLDSATSFHSGLQSWWITFDVKFRETSVWVNRNTVKRYIVVPPFTNHSDQAEDTPQIYHHTNADHADMTYDDHSYFSK